MCAVAKSYMRCDIMGEPFKQNGRMYVTIETPTGAMKNVRWYTDAEWARMYPNEDISVAKANSRTILGFGEAGYITIYYGDTYKNLDWFKAEPECRYHKIWGWYTPSNEEVSAVLPEGVETGIMELNAEKNAQTIYNLSGQKLQKVQKGLYIINGKKTIVR
jgi:hypothetical protein